MIFMRAQDVRVTSRTTRRLLLAMLASGALRPAIAAGNATSNTASNAAGNAAGNAADDTAANPAATDWPLRPIRLIVPFQAGGGADLVARLLVKSLAPLLGQPVVVENRVGAGGVVGAQAVAQAAADGYTLGLATQSTHAANPAFNPRVPYDPVRDFAPISMLALVPGVLAAHPSLPARTMSELIALARRRPREFSYGTPGVGSLGHLLFAQIEARYGLELLHVPYQSGAAALVDAAGGRLHLIGDTLPAALPPIREGRLNAIAVMAEQRVPLLPDVPTFAEVDMAEIGKPAWFGLVAPAGTSPAVIARLNDAVRSAMRSADIAATLASSGSMPATGTADAFADSIRTALQAYRAVVVARGIKPE